MEIKYRGRIITGADVAGIRKLIAEHPEASRRGLSKILCQAWNWVQPNGAPRDMVCRGLMLKLHRGGHIELPPKRFSPPNPLAHRPSPPSPPSMDTSPIEGKLSELQPLQFRQVRRTSQEGLFGSLIEQYHYLGYTQPVGEHLKYIIYMQGRPIACMAWSSAPRHLGCRDRYIGWPPQVRRHNIHLLAYNLRFLILPWVEVEHLASHLLGRVARVVSSDWQRVYNHPVYFLETFVDTERFAGTCYRAANWVYLGETTGRGKDDHTYKPNRSIKAVWGYPLVRNFRSLLRGGVS